MGKLRTSVPKEDIEVITKVVTDAIEIAGGVDNLAAAIGVSRISVWAWKTKQYLPRGSHMLALVNYCQKNRKHQTKKAS